MKNTTKVFAVVTAAALSLGSISAFAADTDETVKRGKRPAFSMNFEAKAGEFKPMGKDFDKMKGQPSEKPELTDEEKAERLEDMKAKLSEKLEAGEITQEQYDERIAAIESGDFKPNKNAPKQGGKMPAGKKPGSPNAEKPVET